MSTQFRRLGQPFILILRDAQVGLADVDQEAGLGILAQERKYLISARGSGMPSHRSAPV